MVHWGALLSSSFTDPECQRLRGICASTAACQSHIRSWMLPPEATQVSSAHIALATASPMAMSIFSKSRKWNSTTDSEEDYWDVGEQPQWLRPTSCRIPGNVSVTWSPMQSVPIIAGAWMNICFLKEWMFVKWTHKAWRGPSNEKLIQMKYFENFWVLATVLGELSLVSSKVSPPSSSSLIPSFQAISYFRVVDT